VAIVRFIFVKVRELLLSISFIEPEAPWLMFMGTATGENIDITGFNRVFASFKGFSRRVACYQMFIEMPSEFSADVISNLRMRIYSNNNWNSCSLEQLSDHL
jgi:hypothetical protein